MVEKTSAAFPVANSVGIFPGKKSLAAFRVANSVGKILGKKSLAAFRAASSVGKSRLEMTSRLRKIVRLLFKKNLNGLKFLDLRYEKF
jgi:hypothetical protein